MGQYLFNKRLFAVLCLGFSSGLPLALTSSTLQAWYTVSGVNILTIGFLGLVGQPYLYRFVWAPLMDRFVPPFLGRRRGWMLITQVALLISIASMAWFDPAKHPYSLGLLALGVAFLSASQDISVDAYRTDLLVPKERGMGSAMAVAGYRIAMLVSGGVALVLASHIGWPLTYLIMAMAIIVGMVISLLGPEPTYQEEAPTSIIKAIADPIKDFLSRKASLAILLFILLYKLSYEFNLVMTPTFLLRGMGFSLIQVGSINNGVGFAALFVGVFFGGLALIRLGVFRSLFLFGSLQALGNLGYLWLAMTGKSVTVLVIAIVAENFFAGMEASAFVAFLMGLCNHRYTAMQFALFSALAAVGRIFAGPVGAMIVMEYGWSHFYFWSFIIAIPALLLLWHLRDRIESGESYVCNV